MFPFTFIQPQNNQEAITACADDAKFIAGGTNLVDLMKMNVEKPNRLVDISRLGLAKIEWLTNGNVSIGSLVRNSNLAYDEATKKKYPVLSQALLAGASPQLRNMATTGGNLLQRTRCPYFYDTVFACNKREPGSGCSAINGYNRSHAILGISDKCIATHPSDMCVALVALDAIINIENSAGKRNIPIKDFHLLPGQTPEKENSLMQGELITSVEIPNIQYGYRSCYLKIRDRASFDFALASAAVILNIVNNKIEVAHIALGGVGTKPWRASDAEKILVGNAPGNRIYQAAAEATLKDAKTFEYNSFKKELAKRTIVKALSTAGGII